MMNTTTKGPLKQRLAAERIRRHWTQLEVADQLGTTPGNVSRWERGITSPGPYFRSKLCELFGRSAHELGLTWDASEDLPTQLPTLVDSSPIAALIQAQANQARGGIGKAQTAIESASQYPDGSSTVLWVKANTSEIGDEGLAMLLGGRNRPEHQQEPPVPVGTHRLHIHPHWVLVLDKVQAVRLVLDVLLSERQKTVTTILCPKET